MESRIFKLILKLISPKIDPNQFTVISKAAATTLDFSITGFLLLHGASHTIIRICMIIDFSQAFDRIDHNIVLKKLFLCAFFFNHATGSLIFSNIATSVLHFLD